MTIPYYGDYLFYNYDTRGSTTNLISPDDGLSVQNYVFDEFGNTVSSQETTNNEVQYTGSVKDGKSGLNYMNSRFYEPATGRFLSQDTYKGNMKNPMTQHLYSYTGNSPTNFVDPTGHRWVDDESGQWNKGYDDDVTPALPQAGPAPIPPDQLPPAQDPPLVQYTNRLYNEFANSGYNPLYGLNWLTFGFLEDAGTKIEYPFKHPATNFGEACYGTLSFLSGVAEVGIMAIPFAGPARGAAVARDVAVEALTIDAASEAAASQTGKYIADSWANTIFKKGTKVWGGYPGPSNFYTTEGTILRTGNDANKIFKGLQVAPQDGFYRGQMIQYELTQDVQGAYSTALSNVDFGAGGLPEYYIPNSQSVLKPVQSMTLTNTKYVR